MSIIQDYLNGKISENDLIFYDTKQTLLKKITPQMIGEWLSRTPILKQFLEKDTLLHYNDKPDSDLKNWLRYRALSALSYRAPNALDFSIDCDISDEAQEAIKKIYRVELYGQSGRHYHIEKYIFESDTMHSFGTVFGLYLQKILAEGVMPGGKTLFELYTKAYNIGDYIDINSYKSISQHYNELNFCKFFYILEHCDKIFADTRKDLVNKIERLARLTHSIFNFGLVPYAFNYYRGGAVDYCDFWMKSYYDSLEAGVDQLAEKITKKYKKAYDTTLVSLEGYRKILNTEVDDIKEYAIYKNNNRYEEFQASVENVRQINNKINGIKRQRSLKQDEKENEIFKLLKSLNIDDICIVMKNMSDCIEQRGEMILAKGLLRR